MKKLYFLLTVSLLLLLNQETKSQLVFFQENFENGGVIPTGWTNIYVASNLNWRYQNGGHSTNPSIPNSRKPTAAHGGSYNAVFEKSNLSATITKLVTPPVNLSLAIKPELQFWYANFTRTLLSAENDEIRIYYRSVDEVPNSWILLASYTDPTEAWTIATVQIPDSVRFTNVQLAFEGTIGPGWGACLDDITIVETGIIPKYLESVKAIQASANNVPTGSINNPILRIDFTVKGNDGNLFIDTLTVDALLQSAQIVPENGIKLYFTTSGYFTVQNPVGVATQFSNGKAVFTNLGLNIPFGYSYLWITYDVPTDLTHSYNGLKLDAKISKDNMIVNGVKYPFVDLNPSGSRTVNESVFFDDFENTSNWTLTGEFQIDHPMGLGGSFGTPDPNYAQNGYNVLGTDLTGEGLISGDYENDVSDNGYTATSLLLNCKYYKDISLQFYRWLNVEYSDTAKIRIDLHSQNQWKNLWINNTISNDDKWSQKQYSIKQYADRVDEVAMQFVIGPTNHTWTFSGWNIDDLAVTGTFIKTDVGVTAWITPGAGCGHVAPEPITVTLKNFGHDATNDTIPVGFSVDEGAHWVLDTLFTSLAQEASSNLTFTPLIDLTAPGNHHILVKTFLPGDQDNLNDQFDTTLYILPTLSLPYSENFESNDGYWNSGGNGTWGYGIPGGALINSAASGNYCWVTKLTNNYPDMDSSWIESPCVVFTGVEKPIFELKIHSETEVGKDGLALYYTIDNGITWKIVPTVDAYNWNWYSGSIEALGTQGWDSVKPGWWMARQTLPAEIAGADLVKFRLVFASNDSINHEGFAIDDIRIYEAPNDAGVTALINPVSACVLSAGENVQVTLKNFGIRSIKITDKLITSLQLNNALVVTDTFHVASNLAPLGTVNFTFSEPVTMLDSGNYYFTAYTRIPEDSNIYTAGVSNDTLNSTKRVNGMPTYSLGPDIGTMQPDTVQVDAGAGYSAYLWHDNSTSRYFAADTAGMFYVTVTNSYGCSAHDSLEILGSTTDLSITAAVGVTNGCILSYTPALTLTVLNNGDTTYHAGDTIQLGYQVNNEAKIIETYTATADIANGESFDYTFTQQPDLSAAGVKNISCFPEFQPQLNYKNDTIYKTIELYPLPQMNLGQDTLFTNVPSPILLDAGPGFGVYDWQDNSSNQTFNISSKQSLKYYVEVTDIHSCGTASDTVWVISDEWKLDSILNPSDACTHLNAETVQIRIKNQSDNSYPVGYSIPAKLVYNNITYNENIVLNTPVAANNTYDYTFAQTFDFSAPGSYSIKAEITPVFDLITTNNLKIKSFATHGVYFVDLGEDTIVTKQADTVLLDAGPHFTSYSWNTGDNSKQIQLPNSLSFLYVVTVTDAFGCQTSSDSVQIMAYDLAIDEIYSPQSKCNLTNETSISFLLHNYGNDIIPAGTNLQAHYQLNGGTWIEKPFSLSYDLQPDNTKTITVSEDLAFVSGQSYSFGLHMTYDKDFFPENDTIYTTVFEFPKPSINLGSDVYTTQSDTIVFQAQLGYANYQWQDYSKNTYFNVTNPATDTYNCLVNNAYGCIDADTVQVFTYDISITDILGDENDCGTSLNRNVQIGVTVNSADTLQAGQEIAVAYQCNGTSASETFVLAEKLYKNKTLYHTFAVPLIINSTGNYPFTAQVSMVNEVKTDNNGYSSTIHVGTQAVNLGADITSYSPNVTVDAGAGFTDYLWNDNSQQQTLVVSATGTYSVTTTDGYGCTDADSIDVLLLIPMYDVIEIKGLADSCQRHSFSDISFVLKNNGNDTIAADSTIAIHYTVNGGATVNNNYTFGEALEPADEVKIPFTTPANLTSPNTYTVAVEVTFGSRTSTLDTTVQTFGLPVIGLPADTVTYADELTLDAGPGFASYHWSDGSVAQTLTVDSDGVYSVTVTNSGNCPNSKQISVSFLKPQYDIVEIMGLADSCYRGNASEILFTLKNNGNDVIKADSTIAISYTINGGAAVNNHYTFATNFDPTEEVPIPFTTSANLTALGVYTVLAEVTFGTITSTQDTTVHTYGNPVVYLPADTTTYESSVLLDAGSGFASYAWSNGSSNQSILVEAAGSYTVTVSNEYGCSSTASSQVFFLNPSYQVTEILGVKDSCFHATNESLSFKLKNSGNDIVYKDSVIPIQFWINGILTSEENYQFAQDLNPDDEVVIQFSTVMDLSASGAYTILVSATFGSTSSVLDITINTWGLPQIDLGTDIKSTEAFELLDAGTGFTDYLWNTDETTQAIVVVTDGDYWVKVTTAHGCENSDTVNVVFLPVSLTVTEFQKPLYGCEELNNEEVTIVIQNTGQKSIPAGANLVFSYKLGDNARVNESYEMAGNFNSNAYLTYNFVTLLSIAANSSEEEDVNYPIDFYVNYENEDIDAANYSITLYSKPVFFDGNDTIKVEEYPYQLEPKVSAESYTWSTGANSETISVTADGQYKLTITQSNTCEFNDSVVVTKITGINDGWRNTISVYPNPSDKKIWIKNTGTELNIGLRVNDLQGKLMYETKNALPITELEISSWPQGVYLLTITNGPKKEIYQIVKK